MFKKYFSSTGQRQVELMRYPFVRLPSGRPPVKISCSGISSVTQYRRDPFMVSYCWPYGLLNHVQFWSNPDPMRPHRGTKSNNCFLSTCMCLRVWSSQKCPGAPEGESSKIHSHPPFPIVRDKKKLFSTNRMHLRDLKGCAMKFFFF